MELQVPGHCNRFSKMTVGPTGWFGSVLSLLSRTDSWMALDNAIYSASVLKRVVSCSYKILILQQSGTSSLTWTSCLLCHLPSQHRSIPCNFLSFLLWRRFRSWKFSWGIAELALLLSNVTMSGLVHIVRYIRLPTTNRYNFWSTIISSSVAFMRWAGAALALRPLQPWPDHFFKHDKRSGCLYRYIG